MNKHIIAYDIVGGFNSSELIDKVQQKMKEGWQPFESPFFMGEELIQSIVKYKPSYSPLSNEEDS